MRAEFIAQKVPNTKRTGYNMKGKFLKAIINIKSKTKKFVISKKIDRLSS
jgi:hypothetical protein